jgi:cytochrome c6
MAPLLPQALHRLLPLRPSLWPWCSSRLPALAGARPLALLLVLLLLVLPAPAAFAGIVDASEGARLFEAHCAGCHVNGGNIIRRGKTLRLAALERQGLASPEAIAGIAAAGIGQMSGYREQLGDAGVQAVAAWVWQQAQADWPRG